LSGIRRATPSDVAELAAMLSRAFMDDPVSTFLFPDASRRPGYLNAFFRLQLEQTYLPKGEVYVADDLAAAVLWMPPDAPLPTLGEQWPVVKMAIRSHSLRRGRKLALHLYRCRPKKRHYYLGTIGTEPERQGQGLGSSVVQPVLARLDEVGMPAYLESSKEENNRFYAGHGFALLGATALEGGPTLWRMWREPVTASGS
jgi:GNAT superfamily N-acetyltransferase